VTASRALSNALLPYVQKMAGHGLMNTLKSDLGLSRGAAVIEGRTVSETPARAYAMDHPPLQSVLPLHEEAR
jgi:alanine dehydrogenase